MSNERELELRHRRDRILQETVDLTSNIVQSLEQQQQLAYETKENLHNQNLLLSLANDKMRVMNEDLNSVVNEMNDIDVQTGCLCCKVKKKKKKQKLPPLNNPKPIVLQSKAADQPVGITSNIPELISNNEQEKLIVNELNQMRNQLVVFQDQVKTINRSFEEGDEIIHQLGNESDQYMHASSYHSSLILTLAYVSMVLVSTALNKAEQVLGRKFVVKQPDQPAMNSNRIFVY